MVEIHAGTVHLRDDRTKEKWQTKVAAFLLAKFQVTQAVYQEITGRNPATFKGENLPVEKVSWYDTIVFCNKLSEIFDLQPFYIVQGTGEVVSETNANGFRLPTEAEWQFACQGNVQGIRYADIE